MAYTNFPNGLTSFGVPLIGSGTLPITNGTYYFVCNRAGANGSNGNTGTDMEAPLATLAQAITNATASENDVIVVMEGHSETITGAGGITMSKAGLTVVGLGNAGQRPRFLMDGAATVTWLITAANCTVKNVVLAAGHADVVTGIGITAAGATIDGVEFVNNVVDENFLSEIKCTSTTDNNADGLTVVNCRAVTVDAAGLEFIEINANLDRLQVCNNFVCKDAATAAPLILSAGTKVLTNLLVSYNNITTGMTTGDLLIDNGASTNSGIVSNNLIGSHDVAGPVTVDCDGVRIFNNYSAATDTTSGRLWPAAETT